MLKSSFWRWGGWVFCALAVLALLPLPATAQPPGLPSLRIVGDNWCPYNCAPDAPQRGYLIDIIDRTLGPTYSLSYELVPWTRALSMVESGEAQVLVGTPLTDGQKTVSSIPMGQDRTCFFVQKGKPWRYKSLDDLKNTRLGVVQDYRYDDNGPLDKLIANYRENKDPRLEIAVGEDALASNFRKLWAGRMDVVVENENVGRFMIQQLKLQDAIVFANCANYHVPTTHVAFSLKRPDVKQILATLESGLAELRRTGELRKILQPYGISDWQTGNQTKSAHTAP